MGTHPIFESDFDCLTVMWGGFGGFGRGGSLRGGFGRGGSARGGFNDDSRSTCRKKPKSVGTSITVLSDLGSDINYDSDDSWTTPPSRTSQCTRNETSGFASSDSTCSFMTPDSAFSDKAT